MCRVVIMIGLFMVSSTRAIDVEDIAEGSGEVGEGSGEVCNVEGSTCPEYTCCREHICKAEGHGLKKCCKNPEKDPVNCANCPECGE